MVEVLAAAVVVALGTYLMRFLPLNMALAGRELRLAKGTLSLAGPALLSALLVTSVLPQQFATGELLRRGAALIPVLLLCRRRSRPGAAVIAGMLAYAMLGFIK